MRLAFLRRTTTGGPARVPGWSRRSGIALLLAAAAGCAAAPPAAAPVPAPAGAGQPGGAFDVLVRGGRIVDGTGNPWYRADVGIRGGRIVEIGRLEGRPAARTIDAGGRVVAPGFVDMMGVSTWVFLADPATAESRLRQGITTSMAGEGGSHAPMNERVLGEVTLGGKPVSWRTFAEYFRLFEEHGVQLNVVHNVGAAQVRRVVVGDEAGAPTPRQMEEMRALVRQAMEDGAVGYSTALIYPPGSYATTEELIEMGKVAAEYGGVYFTHMRNESSQLLDAIRESIRIGEGAGVPVHIFHLKAAGQENWPRMKEALALIQGARARGLDVTTDIYPYIRNGLGLDSFVHPRHYAAGEKAFLATLGDPAVRRALRREIETTSDWENWYRHVGGDWNKVLITAAGPGVDRGVVGLSVQQVADRGGADVWDTYFDLLRRGGVEVAPESMNEEQKREALRAPFVAIETDSPPANPATAASSHPRAFGAFPRVLAKYVREEKVLTLEDAIRRMTSLPANRLGLGDRGRIAPGMAADLVLFDPDRIRDTATFTDPLRFAEGVDYLLVNGEPVIDAGRLTDRKPGQVLRRGR
jgi:N-acyl-D-aspartate/D-glutamate deacylase